MKLLDAWFDIAVVLLHLGVIFIVGEPSPKSSLTVVLLFWANFGDSLLNLVLRFQERREQPEPLAEPSYRDLCICCINVAQVIFTIVVFATEDHISPWIGACLLATNLPLWLCCCRTCLLPHGHYEFTRRTENEIMSVQVQF